TKATGVADVMIEADDAIAPNWCVVREAALGATFIGGNINSHELTHGSPISECSSENCLLWTEKISTLASGEDQSC
ncbi:MAG: hypothetical protein V3S24_22590, partial [Candidatus Tectomicrobia bacterium]